MDKILFLDIDGVLNIDCKKDHLINYLGTDQYFFNELYYWKSMLNLREIIYKTKAQINLISRRRSNASVVQKFEWNLMLYDVPFSYIKLCPCLRHQYKCRGIKESLKGYAEVNYVILDDFAADFVDPDIKKYLVEVNPNLGINTEIKNQVL